jgi:hypothetical protein
MTIECIRYHLNDKYFLRLSPVSSEGLYPKLPRKSDWGTSVPRNNVENGIKLGLLLE